MIAKGAERVETTLGALNRLGVLGAGTSLAPRGLCLHFLGVDEVEMTAARMAASSLRSEYGPLLEALVQHGCNSVHLAFVGPNLEPALHGHRDSFVFDDALQVHVLADTRYYHDFLADSSSTPSPQLRPSLCVLFNAGLWGYDSWQPSLRLFLDGPLAGTPLCVTSFTLEEAEDDYDCVAELAAKAAGGVHVEWLWDCELNPSRGAERLEREGAAGRAYFDSHYISLLRSIPQATTPSPKPSDELEESEPEVAESKPDDYFFFSSCLRRRGIVSVSWSRKEFFLQALNHWGFSPPTAKLRDAGYTRMHGNLAITYFDDAESPVFLKTYHASSLFDPAEPSIPVNVAFLRAYHTSSMFDPSAPSVFVDTCLLDVDTFRGKERRPKVELRWDREVLGPTDAAITSGSWFWMCRKEESIVVLNGEHTTPLHFNASMDGNINKPGFQEMRIAREKDHLATPADVDHLATPADVDHLATPADVDHLHVVDGESYVAPASQELAFLSKWFGPK